MAHWKQKKQHLMYYNQTARLYNTRYAGEQNRKIAAALGALEFKTQSRIVDLGCGTGLLLPRIIGSENSVVCLDLSRGMLHEIEPRLRHSESVHLIQADVDYLPLQSGCFDGVFSITLLQNTPFPQQSLREMKRITKPDATIAITGLKKCFTRKSLLSLLRDTGLQVDLISTTEHLNCHIAICRRETHSSF